MISIENLMSIGKDDLQEASKAIDNSLLPKIVELLCEKDDKIRYQAFLLLQYRSQYLNDVYEFLDTFRHKLKSKNSYERSIGLILIAENAKWDSENKVEGLIDEYLALLKDEKPITIRQCIQSLSKIVPYKPDLYDKITKKLITFNFEEVKETMRKLIMIDILNVLIIIRKHQKSDDIENFILAALSGELLDKKSKSQIKAALI